MCLCNSSSSTARPRSRFAASLATGGTSPDEPASGLVSRPPAPPHHTHTADCCHGTPDESNARVIEPAGLTDGEGTRGRRSVRFDDVDSGVTGSDYMVDDSIRRQNRDLITSMSTEELSETMDSVETLLGPEMFAKLQKLYASGKSIRDLNAAKSSAAGDIAQHGDSSSISHRHGSGDGHTSTQPLASRDVKRKEDIFIDDDEDKEVFDEEPHDADDTYETRSASDLAVLCRSAIPRQRIQAIRRLTDIMHSMHRSGESAGKDGQQLPRAFPVLLRCALDDTNVTIIPVALEALLVFVVRTCTGRGHFT